MIRILKVLLSFFYILALITIFTPLLGNMTTYYQYFIVAVLIAHIFEVLAFMEHIKKYPGSLFASIFLTILYGFLHWLPLKQHTNAKQ